MNDQIPTDAELPPIEANPVPVTETIEELPTVQPIMRTENESGTHDPGQSPIVNEVARLQTESASHTEEDPDSFADSFFFSEVATKKMSQIDALAEHYDASPEDGTKLKSSLDTELALLQQSPEENAQRIQELSTLLNFVDSIIENSPSSELTSDAQVVDTVAKAYAAGIEASKGESDPAAIKAQVDSAAEYYKQNPRETIEAFLNAVGSKVDAIDLPGALNAFFAMDGRSSGMSFSPSVESWFPDAEQNDEQEDMFKDITAKKETVEYFLEQLLIGDKEQSSDGATPEKMKEKWKAFIEAFNPENEDENALLNAKKQWKKALEKTLAALGKTLPSDLEDPSALIVSKKMIMDITNHLNASTKTTDV